MEKISRARITLKIKLLVMFLSVLIIANLVVGIVSYRSSAKGLTQSVYSHIDAVSTDIAHQIEAINAKHFQTLHTIAELDIIKDENTSLKDKQKEIVNVVSAISDNCIDMAFYDANGDALLADGRKINFANRAYFQEAFAGKDFVSDPNFSTVTNSVLQHYSVPVYNYNKKIIGTIVMVIEGNTILDTIANIDMGGGMHPAVLNHATGTTVANANPNTESDDGGESLDKTQGLGLILSEIFEGKEDLKDFVDPNLNTHFITSYKKIPGTTWTVFAVAPYDSYFGVLDKIKRVFIYVVLFTILITNLTAFILVNIIIKPLKTVKESIIKIASGNADLTQRIPLASNDEIGDVIEGFNAFVAKLQGIVTNLQSSKTNLISVDASLQTSTQEATSSITEIISNIESVNNQIQNQAGSVQETAGAVSQISSNIGSLEHMIESQASCVTQASAAVEQMIGNITSVSNSVEKMISSFNTLQRHSNDGYDTQSKANEKIINIEEQSKMLQDANAAIANIAEQTNLLAMNAAIEAAHAGEAGKGFAVVADEIRKLSETSTAQSKTIGSELHKIQDTIQDVVNVSSETNTAFTAITHSISETSEIIEQIKNAMAEQQIGSKQIIEALHSMNDSTSEVRAASNEMTEGNRHILEKIQNLQEETDTMKESIQKMHTGAKLINETGSSLSEISSKVAENIQKIGAEIDLFKI